MASFKELDSGGAVGMPVTDDLRRRGGYWPDGPDGPAVIKHPNFRFRAMNGADVPGSEVAWADVLGVRLRSGELTGVRLPEREEEVQMGLELEFEVIDIEMGKPVRLYGEDVVLGFDAVSGRAEISVGKTPWLLEELGLGPEALVYHGEIGIEPVRTWDEAEAEIKRQLGPVVRACRERGLGLLPTGVPGGRIDNSWANVAVHPYIVANHWYGVQGTALMLDVLAVQAHVDLEPFGGLASFGLHLGNVYNGLPATLINAVATSGPFDQGRITDWHSHREARRRAMSSRGGVMPNIPVGDGSEHFDLGVRLVREGVIPAPERAGVASYNRGIAAHGDTRAAKYSIKTSEFGAADMTSNREFWVAQMVLMRRLAMQVARSVQGLTEVPRFLDVSNVGVRMYNRDQVARYGPGAELVVGGGRRMGVVEAWNEMLRWLREGLPESGDYMRAEVVVRDMLARPPLGEDALAEYHASRTGGRYRGNLADVMRWHAKVMRENGMSGADDEEVIEMVNRDMARVFMDDLEGWCLE